MDKMPWFSIFLESFPETLIYLSMGFVLVGYDLKKNFKRIALTALIFSFLSYFIRSLPILFGYHIFVQIAVLILLVKFMNKFNFRTTLLGILLGALTLVVFETVFVGLIYTKILGIPLDKLTTVPVYRTFIPYIHLSLMLLLVIYIQKKNITVLPLLYKLKSKKYNSNILITFFILFLVLITFVIYATLFIVDKGPINNTEIIRLLTLLLFIFLIIMAFAVRKTINVTESQAIAETQEVYLKNLNDLYTSLRSLRHDFLNQVQVLYGLLSSNQYEEAKEYIGNLAHNFTSLNKVVQIKNPVIAALLQTKMVLAEGAAVKFDIDIKTNFEKLPMTSFDFSRIMGNLLDNAFDSTLSKPEVEKQVKLTATASTNFYHIEVSNTGLPIPGNLVDQIFNSGITTKKDHTGLGLSIIKKIMDKYKGTIGFHSDNEGTLFTLVIPFNKE